MIQKKKDCGICSMRLSQPVYFLDAEMKIQIDAPNELTNRVYALRMKLALMLRVKFAEIHVLFTEGSIFGRVKNLQICTFSFECVDLKFC